MSTTERDNISSPATGLMIYNNTTNAFNFYNGTAWIAISAGANMEITDADNDTKIQVEESADEDKIRFDIKGKEQIYMELNGTGNYSRLTFNQSGNILIGNGAGNGNLQNGFGDNVLIGRSAGQNTNYGYSTIVGALAGQSTTAGYNTMFGYAAGRYNGGGFNTIIGTEAGTNSSGDENVFVGQLTGQYGGSNNVYLGQGAGTGQGTNNNNIFIGYQAGNYFTSGTSNKLIIENSNSNTPLIYGDFDKDTVKIHGTLGVKDVYHFPITDGNAGQALVTDGSGNLSWGTGSDNLGNHVATANIQLDGNYLSNDGSNKGITMDNHGSVYINTSAYRSLQVKNGTYSSYLEVNNGFNTRALFGADGSGFDGGPTEDVILANWSNGALKLYTNATQRIHISKHGLVEIKDTLKITDGSQGAGKVLVSDANGVATWQTLNITVPDTAQPVPIQYHGDYIYVHPTDNANDVDWTTAQTTCQSLTAFGHSDWYLPSRLELDAMYKQSYLITGLSQTEIIKYWSNTAKGATYAYAQRLDYGGPDPDAMTDTSGHNCRCVRKD